MKPLLPLSLLCGLALTTTACVTSSEGDRLRRDVQELQARLATVQLRAEKERQQLQKVMEQATGLLTRNNADVGAQVDRLGNKVAKLTGTVEETAKVADELNKKFSEFQAKVDVKLEKLSSGAPEKKQDPVPEDKEQLYQQGSARLAAGKHEEGRRLLRHFVARAGQDPRVAQAYLAVGNSYYSQGKFANAIQEYRKIFEQHRRAAVYPDALFRIGMSFYQLKYCADARTFLSELSRKHRRHSKAKNARTVLSLIQRHRKSRRFCIN